MESSPLHLISKAISALQIFVCLALTGCSPEDQTIPPPQPQAPIIVAQPTVVVSGLGARITATVNPNGIDTDCYFEYGQNTSYGTHTAAKSIGAGGSGVVVMDTIKGLSWDTTYHCRLIAENSAGRTVGTDQSFTCSSAGWVEFVYPLEAGTTWNYRYSYSYQYYATHQETRGRQVWRSNGPESPNAIKILVTRRDTTISYPASVGGDTVTQITQVDTSFSVIVTPDSLYIQWYQLARHGDQSEVRNLFRIPRIVEQNTDSLTLQFSRMKTVYVSGKGLVSWEDYNSTNFFWDERLILESMSP